MRRLTALLTALSLLGFASAVAAQDDPPDQIVDFRHGETIEGGRVTPDMETVFGTSSRSSDVLNLRADFYEELVESVENVGL